LGLAEYPAPWVEYLASVFWALAPLLDYSFTRKRAATGDVPAGQKIDVRVVIAATDEIVAPVAVSAAFFWSITQRL